MEQVKLFSNSISMTVGNKAQDTRFALNGPDDPWCQDYIRLS